MALSLMFALFFPQKLLCSLTVVPSGCLEAASLPVLLPEASSAPLVGLVLPPTPAPDSQKEMSHPDHWSLPSTHSQLLQTNKGRGNAGRPGPGRRCYFDHI